MKNKTTNRWLTTSLVLGLLGCLADYASPIEVSPPSPVPALSPQVVMVPTIKMVPTVITVKCADDALVFILGIVDGMPSFVETTESEPGKITFTGPPGQYAVMGVEDGKRFQIVVIIKPNDDDPDPDPKPDPKPDPDPTPPPGPRTVSVVYESTDDTPQFALATQRLQSYCNKNGHKYSRTDDDAQDPHGNRPQWLLGYLKHAKDAGLKLPFVVTAASLDGGGTKYWYDPFPLDSERAIAIVKAHGG